MKFIENKSGFEYLGPSLFVHQYAQPFELDEPVSDTQVAEAALGRDAIMSYLSDELIEAGYENAYQLVFDLRYEFESDRSGSVILETGDRLSEEQLEIANKFIRLLQEPSETEHLRISDVEGVQGNNLRKDLELDEPCAYTMPFKLTDPVSDIPSINEAGDTEHDLTQDVKTKLSETKYWQVQAAVESVKWTLTDHRSGLLTMETCRELTPTELSLAGQCCVQAHDFHIEPIADFTQKTERGTSLPDLKTALDSLESQTSGMSL